MNDELRGGTGDINRNSIDGEHPPATTRSTGGIRAENKYVTERDLANVYNQISKQQDQIDKLHIINLLLLIGVAVESILVGYIIYIMI